MRSIDNCWLVCIVLFLGCMSPGRALAQEPPAAATGLTSPAFAAWSDPATYASDGPMECLAVPHVTDRYEQLRTSVQVMAGFYASSSGVGPRPRIEIEAVPSDIRIGCMLWDPLLDGWWCRSNVELLLEFTTLPVVRGPGTIVLGPSALLRDNLVQPDARLVPYIQGGAGVVYDDGYRDQEQRALGRSIEFYLTAAVGIHWQLDPSWSLDAEGGYLHISNADLAPRNLGINAFGGSIGLTYSFGGPHR